MAEENVNLKVEETTTESTTEQPVEQQAPAPAQRQVSLTQIPVNTENDALNMLVAFLQVHKKEVRFHWKKQEKSWKQ